MIQLFVYFITLPIILTLSLSCLFLESLIWIWLFLEISTISYITSLVIFKNKISSIMYFIIQAFSSSLILISMILMNQFNLSNFSLMFTFIIQLTLFIKISLIPFHSWMPWIMKYNSWLMNFLLMTLQKFIPFILIFHLLKLSNFMLLIIIMSIMFSTILALKQNNFKKIMAYSSINHSSWMTLLILMNFNMFFIYYIIYSCLTFLLTMYFNYNKINSQLDLFFNSSTQLSEYIFLIFSYSSIPPFTGFLIKWNLMELLTKYFYSMNFILIILMIFSLIFIYIYLSLIYPNMYSLKFKMKLFKKINWFINNNFILMKFMLFFPFLFLMYSFILL